MKKNTVYLLLGTNIGDKYSNICSAESLISSNIGDILKKSSLYESEAWGFECEHTFYNKIIVVETTFTAFDILEKTQQIEKIMGRKNKTSATYESRIIDIDILFFNHEIIETQRLTIPHPQIANRLFTLLPMNEICPNFVHPNLNITISEITRKCNDMGFCKKIFL